MKVILGEREAVMAVVSYESALQMAQSLSPEERLRLVHDLTTPAAQIASESQQSSILEICGLGAELWKQSDAQEYVRNERASWAG